MTWDRTELIVITDVAPEAGARGVQRSGDGIVLDALREAGARGMSRQQIVRVLGCWGNEQTTTEVHSDEIDSIISYLCELGVARVWGNRWYIITGHEMLKAAAA